MEKTFYAGWKDMDFNQHMKNTAFLEKADDIRLMFFVENGFSMSEFSRIKIGPVVFKDEVEYFKEINLLDEIKITIASGGLSDDGSRFIIRNEFYNLNGKIAARVTSYCTWLDLSERKVTVPPEKLLMVLKSLPKTDDYKDLPTGLK
ncbi:MAG: thioesterase family protein [Spirochaetes bacterium]|nr:thioesterase family protein [Spirochaetota bacterium]